MPETFEDLLDNLRDRNGMYYSICRDFLQCVVGRTTWRELWKEAAKRGGSMQSVASVTDEAFMLLVLDNNWEEWTEASIMDDESESDGSKKKRKSKAKFTADAGDGRNRGWDGNGKLRFKELRKHVEKSRAEWPDWDVCFLKKLAEEKGEDLRAGKNKKKKALFVMVGDDDSINGAHVPVERILKL